MSKAIPYDGAKPMFLVDDVDNQDVLENIILDTYNAVSYTHLTLPTNSLV